MNGQGMTGYYLIREKGVYPRRYVWAYDPILDAPWWAKESEKEAYQFSTLERAKKWAGIRARYQFEIVYRVRG